MPRRTEQRSVVVAINFRPLLASSEPGVSPAPLIQVPQMPEFKLVSDFQPTGDQPTAIEKLVEGLHQGHKHQTLLGATGTGKTYVMAQIIPTTR